MVIENASKLVLLRRLRRALTTAGISAALFRDASSPKRGLARCAKGWTLVRLGLLAAALCWCFVAVPSLSAGVMVMEILPVLRPYLLLGRRARRLLPREPRNRTCIEIPTSQQQRERLGKDPAWHPPWQENKGRVDQCLLAPIARRIPKDFWHHARRCYSRPLLLFWVASDGRNGAVPACCAWA